MEPKNDIYFCFRAPQTNIIQHFEEKTTTPGIQIIESDSSAKENKENNKPIVSMDPQTEDELAQIIPWRSQLRKTNSKLNLLE